MNDPTTEPFLRWAGGKRWLAKDLAAPIRQILAGTYFEPFVGSGALFFALAPEKARLSDLNEDLITTYREVANSPEQILRAIRKLPVNRKTFNEIRSSAPRSDHEKAVRFLYLNRTCYGGIYRENRQGHFNTPYGGGSRTPAPLWERGLIANASKVLGRPAVEFDVCDFELSIAKASAGDVVYCDPTYHAVTREQFDRYGSTVFNWADQIRLAKACRMAMRRGAVVLVSNTFCQEIKNLYPRTFRIRLEKQKCIGKLSTRHNSKNEYLIVLDPFENQALWRGMGKIEQDPRPIPERTISRSLERLYREATAIQP